MTSRAVEEGAKADPGTAAAKKGGCTCTFVPATGVGLYRTAPRILWDKPTKAGGGYPYHWPSV